MKNERRITRTIPMADIRVVVYNKGTKEIEEKDDVIPYHGEDILELAKTLAWLTTDDRIVDAEIIQVSEVKWSISERDFMVYGRIEA